MPSLWNNRDWKNKREGTGKKRYEHYENMPMQYTEIFKVIKIKDVQQEKFDIFLIFAPNIDCGYTLELPHRGGSNEYPQSMFWSKSKKNRYTSRIPQFCYIKVGFNGVYITRTCFRDGKHIGYA